MSSGIATFPGLPLPALETPGGALTLTSRLVARGQHRYTLHLSGSLHPAWAARLASGLAARDVSVVRATARRGATRWTAEIEIQLPPGAAPPSAIDFVALMREHRDPAAAGAVALGAFRLRRTRTDLEVELRAEDSVGFLGRVLLVFAEHGLFPRAMRVETIGTAVRDAFLLQGLGGEPPPAGVVALLERRLAALVPEE